MNKNLNRFFKKPVIVAAELFSAGWCNLECNYCYIPKTEMLKGIHKNIIDKIQDGTYLSLIKDMIGPDLDSLSHWGTEPTLTTKYFRDFYKDVKNNFPKLKKINLSSNFMTSPKNLFEFVTEVLPPDHKLEVSLQVSCDGPPYITDKNRLGGSTSKILDNCLELTRMLNEANFIHNVVMHVKPTFSVEDIWLCSNYDKMEEYYVFFDNFFGEWFKSNSNKKVDIQNGVDPTIVLPGSYTSEDGKKFNKLYENQLRLQKEKEFKNLVPDSNYYVRLKNKIIFYKEYFTKQKMFVCSAGDSCVGLGDIPGTIHPCHATFYLDHPEYFKEALEYGLDFESHRALKSGKTLQLRDGYVVNGDDDLKFIKSIYPTRGYNDFTKLKISSSLAMVLECANAGQISKIYQDVELAKFLSFIIQTTECPINSILITGSVSIPNISLIRLYGNGFFEAVLRRFIKEIKR